MKKDQLVDIVRLLEEIKSSQPNGELKRIENTLETLSVRVEEMHGSIMHPINGLIVSTNKNTEFREVCSPERDALIDQFKGIIRWKKTVEWVLGVLFVTAIGAVVKTLVG